MEEAVPAFETEQLTVKDLYSAKFVFEFPLYQRPFRWGEHQATALLNDLREACEEYTRSADSGAYFLGSVVLVRAGGSRRALVIDGRQRLTALAIMIAVLRDLETDALNKTDLHKMLYDQGSKVNNIEAGARLRVSGKDGADLERWIFSDGATNTAPVSDEEVSERLERVVDVAALFRQTLASLDAAERARLRDFVLHSCELVAVITANEDKGLRIFQVLNTRGLALSDTDLIKPDLLLLLDEGNRDSAAEKFDEIEIILGSRDMSNLLRSIFFIIKREIAPERRDRFHESFVALVKQHDPAKIILQDIERYGSIFAQMKYGELPFTDRSKNPNLVIQSLRWLGWDSEDWRPVAIAIVAHCGADAEKAYKYLLALERTCYFSFVLVNNERVGRTGRRELFADTLDALAADRDLTAAHEGLWMGAERRQQLKDALRQPLHTFPQRGALLRRAEAARSGSDHLAQIDDAIVLHILPPKLRKKSEWPAFNAKGHRDSLNLLGNLVLADPGQAHIGPRTFGDKKRLLLGKRRRGQFETTRDLESLADWTPAAVQDRTRRMADALSAAWELN